MTRARDELFGRAYATLDKLSDFRFENARPTIGFKYWNRFDMKPMSTLVKAHKDVMEYTRPYTDQEAQLLERFNGYIAELDTSTFTDERLTPQWLIFRSKEASFLDKIYPSTKNRRI